MTLASFGTSIGSVIVLVAALPGLTNAQQSHGPTAQWQLADEHQFFFTDPVGPFSGAFMTQGITTDGTQWYFSWQYGLEIVNDQLREIHRQAVDIPVNLLLRKLDHIGDIDYHDGILYASLDTTHGFNNGHVALYNASDLSYTGVSYTLTGAPSNPNNDIASWVAVDPSGTVGYGKEWQLGNTINTYTLPGWSFAGVVTLDLALQRIQGAKVHGDWLYMSSDDDGKTVYRGNLRTGHVEQLFTLPDPDPTGRREVEGIALRSALQVCAQEQAQGQSQRDCSSLSADAVDLYVAMVVDPDNAGNNALNPNLHVSLYHYAAQP